MPNPDPKVVSNPQPRTKRVKSFSSKRWLGLICGLTGVAMISATAGALLAVSLSSKPLLQHQLSAEDAAVFSQDDMAKINLRLPELTRPVNILVLGVKVLTSDVENPSPEDNKLGYLALVNSFQGLTDTMLLIRFDPQNKKLKLLSIPRDTRTFVEGRGIVKINDANYYGGPASSAKAVSELLGGVGIDRYIRINVQGVEKLIDALGGITVHVPKDMKYQDDSQHLYINLKAGKQHLNGNQALQFLRFRYDALGDIGRIQRQQMMMRAFAEQVMNVETLSRLPKILSVIQSHLDTNLTLEELVALSGFATEIDRSNVEMLMVPGEFSDPKEFKASYWLPDHDAVESLMAKHFDMNNNSWTDVANVEPTLARVAIQDSNDNQDGVEKLAHTLAEIGYQHVKIDKPWTVPLKVTKIVAQDGDPTIAKALQQSLGFGEVVVESTGNIRSDVTIQLGQDWLEKQSKNSSQSSDDKESNKR